jgi:hypothetical protein
VNTERGVKGSKHRHRISDLAWYQIRLEGCVTGAFPRLCVDGDSSSDVQYRDDLHP